MWVKTGCNHYSQFTAAFGGRADVIIGKADMTMFQRHPWLGFDPVLAASVEADELLAQRPKTLSVRRAVGLRIRSIRLGAVEIRTGDTVEIR